MMPRLHRRAAATVLLLYLLVAGLYAVQTPAWQSPDEPAHYNVVRQLALGGPYPVIAEGDWDQAYLAQLTAAKFAPALLGDFEAIQYEDHQPPLYYLLLTPVYQLSGGSLVALRLASVVMGAAVVLAAYAISLRVYPAHGWAAVGTAAFVGFVPQHLHILASVNNDALAWALGAWALWACIDHAAGGKTPAWALGLLVGLILATKTTVYLMGGVAVLAIVLRGAGRWPALLRFGLAVLPLAALWWGRNLLTYGLWDVFGLRAHDAVVIGQLRTADLIAQVGASAYLQSAVQTTYASFWGMFGWMAVPIPLWTQAAFGALVLVGAAGFGVWRGWREAAPRAWLLMLTASALGVAMLVYYNTQFVQFQGRYAYAVLIPLAMVVAHGLDAWRARLPLICRWPWLTPAALTVGMVGLSAWLLLRVLVPQLAL